MDLTLVDIVCGTNYWDITKVDEDDFQLRTSHIAKVLEVADEGDKTCFDNIRTSNFLEKYLEDEIVGTVITLETRFTN